MMVGMLPEYGALGKIKAPTGGRIATAAPSNAYPTRDRQWVLIAANSEPLFAKLMALIGRSDLVGTSGYSGNRERVENADVLDQLIRGWSCCHDAPALIALLDEADLPNPKVRSAARRDGQEGVSRGR